MATTAAFWFTLCRGSNCNCPVVNILKTCKEMIRLWNSSFFICFCFDWESIDISHRPVTAQLQLVTDHSLTSRRPVSTDRKHIVVRTVNSCRLVSDQSLTSCKTYHRLIGDHKLIPDGHYGLSDRQSVAMKSDENRLQRGHNYHQIISLSVPLKRARYPGDTIWLSKSRTWQS